MGRLTREIWFWKILPYGFVWSLDWLHVSAFASLATRYFRFCEIVGHLTLASVSQQDVGLKNVLWFCKRARVYFPVLLIGWVPAE